MTSPAHLYRSCAKCGAPVHAKSLMCKCGEASPWSLPQVARPAVHVDEDLITEHRSFLSGYAQTVEPAPPPVQEAPQAWVVDKDFRTVVNGTLLSYNRGTFINDKSVLTNLLRQKCPIVPVGAETVLIRCPKCHALFTPEADHDGE